MSSPPHTPAKERYFYIQRSDRKSNATYVRPDNERYMHAAIKNPTSPLGLSNERYTANDDDRTSIRPSSLAAMPRAIDAHLFLAVCEHVELHPAAVPDNARPLHYQLPVPFPAQHVQLRSAAAAAARLRYSADDLPLFLGSVVNCHVLAAGFEPRTREASEVTLERQDLIKGIKIKKVSYHIVS